MTSSDTDISTELSTELERLAATPVLLIALDFDGTLAPLLDEPMSARALPDSKAAVERLAGLPDTVVAFVSGRMLADLRIIAEHQDDSRIYLAGSHGAEFWFPAGIDDTRGASAGTSPSERDTRPDAVDADAIRAAADDLVADIDGAWIEHKALGFALHTRKSGADDAARATRDIDALVAERAPAWRRRTGQDILEFSTSHAGKDAAVAALRASTGATAVLFAGDDVTDEDAIAALGADDLGIRVGPGETSARVRVDDAEELAGVLSTLAKMRGELRQ